MTCLTVLASSSPRDTLIQLLQVGGNLHEEKFRITQGSFLFSQCIDNRISEWETLWMDFLLFYLGRKGSSVSIEGGFVSLFRSGWKRIQGVWLCVNVFESVCVCVCVGGWSKKRGNLMTYLKDEQGFFMQDNYETDLKPIIFCISTHNIHNSISSIVFFPLSSQ